MHKQLQMLFIESFFGWTYGDDGNVKVWKLQQIQPLTKYRAAKLSAANEPRCRNSVNGRMIIAMVSFFP